MKANTQRGIAGRSSASESGSVFIMAIFFLAVMALISAVVLSSISTRSQVSNQIAGWHEAGLAAEAGLDITIAKLSGTTPWSDWKLASGTQMLTQPALLAITGSYLNSPTPPTYTGTSGMIYYGTSLALSTGIAAYINVNIQGFRPPTPANAPLWFKIRSMGTAPVGGPARSAMERGDSDLRRLSLWNVRENLVAVTGSIPSLYPAYWRTSPKQPSVSRVIEVIAKPYAFNPFGQFALFTQKTMDLGSSNNYGLDSYNSDTSSNHQYPGSTTRPANWDPNAPLPTDYGTIAHWGANIGTNSTANGAISTNGSKVYGTAQTPGGVSGVNSAADIKLGVNAKEPIPLPLPPMPVTSGWPAVPTDTKGNVLPMSANPTTPAKYYTATNPGAITFTGTGYVTLVVDANWNIGTGNGANVIIPPSVFVTIYVTGDIDFGNGEVNMGNGSSGIPTHLIIYGMAPPGYGAKATDAALDTSGKVKISAAFYGPNYAVRMSGGGSGAFCGSIIADSFSISGGGGSSIHYDEALQNPLPNSTVSKYQVSSYFEDTRL